MSSTHGKPGGPKRAFRNAYVPPASCVCPRPKPVREEEEDGEVVLRCVGCGRTIEEGRRADR